MIYKKGKPTPDAKQISFSPLLTLLKQTKESINVSGSATVTTPTFPGLQLSSWKYFLLQKKALILLWYLKVLCHEIYQNSKSGKRHQIESNIKITAQNPGTWVLKSFAGYVPLASQSLYPIIVYSVANYRPHLSHFWANMYFSRSQLSHFLFLWIDPFLDWMKNTLLFICSTNILVRLLTVNVENCLTSQKSENVLPHFIQSSLENGTPSSGTSPLASYKEVLPPPPSGSKQ